MSESTARSPRRRGRSSRADGGPHRGRARRPGRDAHQGPRPRLFEHARPGRDRRCDRGRRHGRPPRRRHGAGRPRTVPAERGPGSDRGRPGARPRADHDGRPVRPGAEPGRRALAAARLQRGGSGHRLGGDEPSRPPAPARTEEIAVREATNVLGLWVDGGRCLGVLTPEGPIAARATILAMGGAAALWARIHQPGGPDRRRHRRRRTPRAPRSRTWSSCSSTPRCWPARGCS